jgi:23S rRNA (pseudouridine1915-N3)-methyltransferase
VDPKKPGKSAEAEALRARLDGGYLIVCDEHGDSVASRSFAGHIARLRDDGERHLVFVIGGANGLDAALLGEAREKIAFGVQTWPHALVRVMLAEQVYRAVSILAGSPYHRD